MFYSLQEAAGKLSVTEEEVKQLAAEGKLREFRDGSNVMFKVDEVEGLAVESGLDMDHLNLAADVSSDTDDLDQFLDLESDDESVDEVPQDDLLDAMIEDERPEPVVEQAAEAEPVTEDVLLDEPLNLSPEDEEPVDASDKLDGFLDLAEEVDQEADGESVAADLVLEDDLELEGPDDLLLDVDDEVSADVSDTQFIAEAPEEPIAAESTDDDLLGLDDTALTGEGISVLSESDADFKLTDDTLAETLAGLGATGETSIEEIEDDISLDSFGSGSGLLDLSLQADDTSLGGILDEIYTSDDDESPADADSIGTTEGGLSGEVDTMSGEVEEAEVYAAPAMPLRSAGIEIPPDSSSNMLGGLLFLPLFVLLYASIVAISGMNGVNPSILSGIQGFIWYVLGGLGLIGLVVGIVGMTSGAPKKPKAKKAKKEKKPKAKKEKKPKKEKKAKKK